MNKQSKTVQIGIIVGVLCMLTSAFLAKPGECNALVSSLSAISELKLYKSKSDFKDCIFENCKMSRNKTLTVCDESVKSGSMIKSAVVSPVIASDFILTELIPSWNIGLPAGAGVAVYFQVSPDGIYWTDWLYIGRMGEIPENLPRVTKSDIAEVDTDYVLIMNPCKFYKWKVEFFQPTADAKTTLSLFAVSCGYANIEGKTLGEYAKFYYDKKRIPSKEKWAKQLNVPYRSQLDVKGDIAGAVCCPTSLAMVLEYYKINKPTEEVCDTAFDKDYRLWGSWWRAAQTLYHYGLTSYVIQIRDYDEIKEYIAKDIPVVISIKANPGELPSSPYGETPGHILTIVGLDEDESAWVNDPYNTDGFKGARKYTKKEIEDVLIKKGGVAFIAYEQSPENSGIFSFLKK